MKQVQHGAWSFKVSSEERFFDSKYLREALDYLNKWKKVFPNEDTWVQRELGVPSILVRLDCVPNVNLGIFEIEERPSGFGVSMMLNQSIVTRFQVLKKQWPEFSSVVSDKRNYHDDSMWLPSLSLKEAIAEDGLLLVRAEPEETEFHILAHRSVSTVITKGHKGYGSEMGLWYEVTPDDFDSLPWNEGFSLKPMQGSKTRNVEIWHPKKNVYAKQHIGGISTRMRIRKTLERQTRMYCQTFIQPLDMLIEGRKFLIAHRIYFGYNFKSREYEFLGGVWNARPNMMIHGASDAIFGPVN